MGMGREEDVDAALISPKERGWKVQPNWQPVITKTCNSLQYQK
jgi:hypothetical protein